MQKRLAGETTDVVDFTCCVGATQRLPARLVALRLCEKQTNKRRRDIKRHAKRRRISVSKKRLQLAGWDIYMTNVEAHQLTAEQIATLARIRWQIELMFKCFKSIGRIHVSRSQKPYHFLCQVYAKLIAQLIKHWVMIATGWRCIQHDIIKTAKLIALYACTLTVSFHKSKTALRQTLEDIKRALQHTDSGRRRNGKQTTFKRLPKRFNSLN